MNFVPYDVKKIDKSAFYKRTENLELLEAFVNSDLDCVQVKNFVHKKASICAASLRNTANRYRIKTIRVVCSKGEVFLVKTKI